MFIFGVIGCLRMWQILIGLNKCDRGWFRDGEGEKIFREGKKW